MLLTHCSEDEKVLLTAYLALTPEGPSLLAPRDAESTLASYLALQPADQPLQHTPPPQYTAALGELARSFHHLSHRRKLKQGRGFASFHEVRAHPRYGTSVR
ncbi:hypothetical protein SEA_DUSK_59 [Mycobacterium phage Dusk]|uniref:Uncharacterized protein n=1 Tax=Mycobacterium phage Dusk TaxID=1679524 RepID=A0A0H4TI82_9CAUD|nr:hypothetical protein SEA_DUSK_59 [Mycobacterium phage Dusk]AKQ08058.1 hypothetical protein SEA_DUSK_59 [Mycobacterium phage Dusk]QIQ63500.1 hypothetical protein SEA_BADSTONE_59 [Mycobacterium phage BadStone]